MKLLHSNAGSGGLVRHAPASPRAGKAVEDRMTVRGLPAHGRVGNARDRERPLPRFEGPAAILPTLVAVVSLVSLLLLTQLSGVVATSYDLRNLEEVKADWEQVNYQLEVYVANLQSLERADREARERLKMVPASHVKYVRVATPLPARSNVFDLPPTRRGAASPTPREDGLWDRVGRYLKWLVQPGR